MKKTVKLSALLLCVAGMFSSSAMAVDGYKNLKFGMSKKEVISSKICSLQKMSSDSGVDTYMCADLKFGNSKSPAAVYFIGDKFVRLGIIQPFESATAILKQLISKYGQPEKAPDEQILQDIYSKPNITADILFDNKTVALRLTSNDNNIKQALVLYSVPNYDDLLTNAAGDSVSNDL